jgi:hypothetical protein
LFLFVAAIITKRHPGLALRLPPKFNSLLEAFRLFEEGRKDFRAGPVSSRTVAIWRAIQNKTANSYTIEIAI